MPTLFNLILDSREPLSMSACSRALLCIYEA